MPDYSHFHGRLPSGKAVAAVKISKGESQVGAHLKIEVVVERSQEKFLDALIAGFHALLESLSPVPPIYEQTFTGDLAQVEADQPIEEYYRKSKIRYRNSEYDSN